MVVGFLRLSTHAAIFDNPLTAAAATGKIDTWLALPNVAIVTEQEGHWPLVKQLIQEIGTVGNLTNDAHLAALAISYGATIASCDGDFNRFRQVRWENPLAI